MRGKIQLEILESEVLNSIATQSKEETFEFVSKILNSYNNPTEIAGELIHHIEDYIEDFHRNEQFVEFLDHTDGNGNYTGKYRPKQKKERLNHKPFREDRNEWDDKPSYALAS